MILSRAATLAILLAVVVAGCATDPSAGGATPTPGASPAATPTTTPPATPQPTPPGGTPPPGGIWEGMVTVTIVAEPTQARAGEEIRLTLAAKNDREASVWTNPSFVCDGSWSIRIQDANGATLRVDDSDAMGCPTTDTYGTQIAPGENRTAVYPWDGMLRPSFGQAEPAPPGHYTVTGTVRWATELGTSNGSGETADEASASVVVEIV